MEKSETGFVVVRTDREDGENRYLGYSANGQIGSWYRKSVFGVLFSDANHARYHAAPFNDVPMEIIFTTVTWK